MASLIQLTRASKHYGDQVLLDGAEATISDNTKVGFIGRNGAGKSTTLRIILGEEELDSGEVSLHPSLRVGYLRQHDPFLPGETSLEFLMRDSGQPDWKCGEVAGQFEIKGAYLDGPVAKLSGGWQTRLKLAALLLHEPNLLVLDEPTNFLDLRTQILLEHFLRDFRAACLIVSHDRAFLNATCTHTLCLSRGKLTAFPGKVDAFLDFQRENRERDERSNAAVMAKRKHLEDFIARNKARAATAGLAQSKAKALEKLELTEVSGDEPVPTIRPPRVEPRKGTALRCRDLTIGYPDRAIATDVQLEIEHGSRAAVVGDNGQGKTTFLRTLVDSLKPLAGEVRWGHGCKVGVYAQHVYTSLPEKKTVVDHLRDVAAFGKKEQEILEVAGSLLFRGSDVKKPVSILSGGERARLCLAGLLLSDYNVLILDEPGNHLDVDTVDALVDALREYQGTVIFTSHDRHFTTRVATCIIEVREGKVLNYTGKYEDYVYRVNKEIEAGEREQAATRAKLPDEVAKARPAARGPQKTEKELRKELKALERTIAQLDEQRRGLTTALAKTTNPTEAARLQSQIDDLTLQIDPAEERWVELNAEIEGMEEA
ncbi:abc transporter atp-binding protein : ABC transporter related protein OS=Planctomyces limnophilus (strain ATCC 43296 / DSM 3776 / IFAM 1008 / 290) GN=Plim_1648 PE=3 SV=1: ABC_tran: ABC_tran_2: ABC_tran [Gemmataceae bacterium]|nr:abc transporter atp-binding protein : ABC transporter related protein OS=Planctomyces limnophilus (strain ATCC 43296 / DSM 3776 / IFAM 1008 / 290) GN=Plim_1648 PE=3 SV=1: ABC_tran: ABC_tran_2: ABC_tran [Gemmataceae bacterium]VTT98617.1 abc transporter atp-binding protein : ABC transporter related protein OS=Planctomyces limnophilus (strain ATCC 43296 / DSM 3776 / IFAM 1008 / 290) GN=Plim_1648 PE=3 SV=1: ABC_tran: ABC_tran_2: ABC_tran [Gemmataceae bacterium]